MAPALPAAPPELDASSDYLLCSNKAEFCDLPVVDMGGVDGERRHLVLQHIRRACEDGGVFQVINHGVPASLLTRMLQLSKEFFLLPVEEKRKFSTLMDQTIPKPVLVQGYSSKEHGKCFLEWGDQLRHITYPVSARNHKLWPTNPPSYRETEEEYVVEQDKFGKLMMELISESLGLRKSAVSDVFGETYQQTLVVNHYPPCPDPDLTVGVHEHSDFSIFTILLQDAPGLEVLTKDGGWGLLKPVRDALVVNLGDQMQILSNGKYQCPIHRATVNGERRRVSINSFTNPSDDTLIAPISALVSESHPALYQGRTFGAYKAKYAAQWKEKNAILKSAGAATL